MANTLPNIDVIFKQRATTFLQKGDNAILIIKDDTDKTFNRVEYKNLAELEQGYCSKGRFRSNYYRCFRHN